MVVQMSGSAQTDRYSAFIRSEHRTVNDLNGRLCSNLYLRLLPQSERLAYPSYPSIGGLLREESIILLRKFYLRENQNGKSNYFLLITISALEILGSSFRMLA